MMHYNVAQEKLLFHLINYRVEHVWHVLFGEPWYDIPVIDPQLVTDSLNC
jgi:hypothetical protein